MSVHAWDICPRCLHRGKARASNDPHSEGVDPQRYRTFGESLFFYGAPDGCIAVQYSARCTACGLTAELEASKKFWVPGKKT